MPTAKLLGVLGGLGPMASAYFYELVTAHTQAARDQDHIDMVISSRATTPDRTGFILGEISEDPFAVMVADGKRLENYGADLIAVPCNTAHFFYDRLAEALTVPILNMVRLTAARVRALGGQKAGILATTGTVRTETYQRACGEAGIGCAVPSEEGQRALMDVIYKNIKQNLPPDMALFQKAADELFAAGCDRVILGCTELSLIKKAGLLDSRYLDSMDVLAEAAIRACGKTPVGFAPDGAPG